MCHGVSSAGDDESQQSRFVPHAFGLLTKTAIKPSRAREGTIDCERQPPVDSLQKQEDTGSTESAAWLAAAEVVSQ
jgi:hypothetical protein